MKKVLLTLAFGLFFITFTNAQSTLSETADAKKAAVEQKACEPGCTKDCCAEANKKSKAKLVKDSKSCDDKKSSGIKTKSCADKKRPSTCKD